MIEEKWGFLDVENKSRPIINCVNILYTDKLFSIQNTANLGLDILHHIVMTFNHIVNVVVHNLLKYPSEPYTEQLHL